MAQADIHELPWEGRAALLKDFSGRPWWVRLVWSRRVMRREIRTLQSLEGVAGIPRVLALAGRNAFVLERLNATRMPKIWREAPPPPAFWINGRRLIEQLHARGVGHGDLRRKNILMGPGGEAYLIDFATALRHKPRGWNAWLINALLVRYQQVDRVTWARIKASYRSARLDEEERRWLAEEPWFLSLGRWLKKRVYRLRKPQWWRDRFRMTRDWVRGRFTPRH